MALGLGILGLLCAVLGVVMILMVPSLIKQQVLKVSEVSWGVGGGEGIGTQGTTVELPSHHQGGPGSPQRPGGLSHQRPRGLNLTEAEV